MNIILPIIWASTYWTTESIEYNDFGEITKRNEKVVGIIAENISGRDWQEVTFAIEVFESYNYILVSDQYVVVWLMGLL